MEKIIIIITYKEYRAWLYIVQNKNKREIKIVRKKNIC